MQQQQPSYLQWVGRHLTTANEANQALIELYQAAAQGHCHALRGRIRLASVLPGFAVVIHEIVPTPDDITKMGGKGAIYNARFVRKVADMAGLSQVRSRRLDGDRDPYLREVEVTLTGRDLTGRERSWVGTYELDLRDGSPRSEAALRARSREKNLEDKRSHITQACTTGAYCRAVVDALALQRGGFEARGNKDPIWLPLYLPVLEIHLQGASPAVRDAITLQALSAVMGVYGPAAQAQPAAPPPAEEPEPEVQDQGPADDYDDSGEGYDPDGDAYEDPPFDDPQPEAPAPPPPPPEPDPEPAPAPPPQERDDNPDRPISADEKAKLESLGVYRQAMLAKCGWTKGHPVTLAVYREAIKRFGGAQ